MLYNLSVVQAAAQISCRMSESQRLALSTQFAESEDKSIRDINQLLGFIIHLLNNSRLYNNAEIEDDIVRNDSSYYLRIINE